MQGNVYYVIGSGAKARPYDAVKTTTTQPNLLAPPKPQSLIEHKYTANTSSGPAETPREQPEAHPHSSPRSRTPNTIQATNENAIRANTTPTLSVCPALQQQHHPHVPEGNPLPFQASRGLNAKTRQHSEATPKIYTITLNPHNKSVEQLSKISCARIIFEFFVT